MKIGYRKNKRVIIKYRGHVYFGKNELRIIITYFYDTIKFDLWVLFSNFQTDVVLLWVLTVTVT